MTSSMLRDELVKIFKVQPNGITRAKKNRIRDFALKMFALRRVENLLRRLKN